VKQAAAAPPSADPRAVAQNAAIAAASQHAPGLIGAAGGMAMPGAMHPHHRRRTGRWMRHGNRIVIYGA
jgi:hypothetical protein